ncbi:glycoside hydrolase family 15 protein [Streptomyces sp. NPDC058861]|uniref:glycoside hydrolase family 15 protein n=1 Tax=Streptomyces sp. NPDC058861 TaxID=3346653 RepID=UPI0036A17E09
MLPPVEDLARSIGQPVKLTRQALRELDADGDIVLSRRGAARRLRPDETHPKDEAVAREIRAGILSGHYRSGTPLPTGLLARRHSLGVRRMARVCRPLLGAGLLVHRGELDGPRLYVAVPDADQGGAGLIEDHALLSDQRGSALVRSNGDMNWLCLGRFDDPALLARLLGTAEHGLWRLAPAALPGAAAVPVPVRRYLGETLVHEIEWVTGTGTVKVTDFMPPGGEASQVVPMVTGVRGEVAMHSLLRVRPDYGHYLPRLDRVDDRCVALDPGQNSGGRLWAQATVPLRADGGDLRAAFTVTAGETVAFSLTYWEGIDSPPPQPALDALLKATLDHWTRWAGHCTYTGKDRADVLRSLLTLGALIYAPTGAIVAAATTSLPEEIGGVRQWDYRYTWLRDGALTSIALARCGYLDEALAWIDWMVRACAGTPERRRIMYRIDGGTDLREEVLAHLPGYEGSVPVRIGNGAADQLQLDVYGELADALREMALAVPAAAPRIAAVLVDLATELEPLWHKPDRGAWEIRGPLRHMTHSKMMSWATFDRAVRAIEQGWATGPLERWRELRETIHRDVCEKGYDPERNTFTQSYGSTDIDAALLHGLLTGFLPADDKRTIGTIEAVQRELGTDSGLLLRYPTEGEDVGVDGLTGDEGHFLIGTGWLSEALVRIGRVDEAQTTLATLVSLRNDVGLLAEEYDPHAGRQLGNFPQAFSHLAHVRAAQAVGSASARAAHATAAPQPTGTAS